MAADRDDVRAPMDTATRLAYENVYLAHERTLMSWVQVALALITFGFTIAKAFQYVREIGGTESPNVSGRAVGILMIVIGLTSLIVAVVQNRIELRAMRAKCPDLPVSRSGILAAMLAILGIVALAGAILRH